MLLRFTTSGLAGCQAAGRGPDDRLQQSQTLPARIDGMVSTDLKTELVTSVSGPSRANLINMVRSGQGKLEKSQGKSEKGFQSLESRGV